MRAIDSDAPKSVLRQIPGRAGQFRPADFAVWRDNVRRGSLAHLADFVATRCLPQLERTGIDVAADVLTPFVDGGKCLRSTFMYLGWLCGADDAALCQTGADDAALCQTDADDAALCQTGADDAALRASAALELLHAFALLQDDVMDDSGLRRGRPAAHLQFGQWHRDRGLSGSSSRFGASLAILLGDLCLVWAEQMMRESGVPHEALVRAWPHYDAMRVELAVGQFADVANDAGARPSLDAVLDVARRKSGNYTVRRPLEIGAVMADRADLIDVLSGYGTAVGEAFQLRDDILGVFGSPAVTGKPVGGDLTERKATSVIVAAHRMAEPDVRRQIAELMAADELDESDIDLWRTLIRGSGAVDWIEGLIAERLSVALDYLDDDRLGDWVQSALADMAVVCTERMT